MHLQIISRQIVKLTTNLFLPILSLLFYQKWESWPLKEKKVTILHLAVSIYCIHVFFVCIVKNSHNKQCCDVTECGVLHVVQYTDRVGRTLNSHEGLLHVPVLECCTLRLTAAHQFSHPGLDCAYSRNFQKLLDFFFF